MCLVLCPDDSQFWYDAAAAAEYLAREAFGVVEVAKALDPLDPGDFVKLVNGFAADLARVSGPIELRHVQAAVQAMDVDWRRVSPEARRKALLAANAELRKAVPRVVPKVSRRFDAHVTRTSKGARASASRRFGLKIEASFDAVDQRVLDQIANDQGLFVTNQYGRLHKTFTRESKQIAESGLAQGLRSEEIASDLAAAAKKYGTLRTGGYWRVLASAYTNRSRIYSNLASMNDAGLKRYRFEAVLDERTTEQCRMLDGREFNVDDGLAKHREVQEAKDPTDVKSITPWIRQRKIDGGPDDGKTELFVSDKDGGGERRVAVVEKPAVGTRDGIGEYSSVMSNKEMADTGIAHPPLHGLCRSTIVPV